MLRIKNLIYVVLSVFLMSNITFSTNIYDKMWNIFLDQIDESLISEEVFLVEIKECNPKIIVDMKYITSDNSIGKPISAETKCLVSRQVMKKLNAVQAELEQQGLGLKVFDGFRPLYIETALLRYGKNYKSFPDDFSSFCAQLGLLSYFQNFYYKIIGKTFIDFPDMPLSNTGAMVSVTLITADGKELAMPTKFDDRSKKAHADYPNFSCHIIANRDLLARIMVKYGFEQGNAWYEFYDNEAKGYPRYLHVRHTTALALNKRQQKDLQEISSAIAEIVHGYIIEHYSNLRDGGIIRR